MGKESCRVACLLIFVSVYNIRNEKRFPNIQYIEDSEFTYLWSLRTSTSEWISQCTAMKLRMKLSYYRLKVWWQLLLFFLFFVFFIHSNSTFIHIHSPRPPSVFFIASLLRRKNLPGVPSGDFYSGLTEPRCSLLSHAAHWLSHAALTELRCTLLSHAAPFILIRHITFSVGNLHSLCIDTYSMYTDWRLQHEQWR